MKRLYKHDLQAQPIHAVKITEFRRHNGGAYLACDELSDSWYVNADFVCRFGTSVGDYYVEMENGFCCSLESKIFEALTRRVGT